MTVSVTADDIRNGGRAACWSCPIAMAIHNATGREWGVFWSSPGRVSLLAETLITGATWRVHLPASCAEFVRRFDGGLDAAPFDFDLHWEVTP